MKDAEIRENLESLYRKSRKTFDFESGTFVCKPTFKEVEALREAIEHYKKPLSMKIDTIIFDKEVAYDQI